MGRTPTIKDVAKRAGVAVSTASLALNGKPGVSAETRAKVLKAALELDYHPHVAAKNLADGRTRTIGLIAPISLEHLFASAGFFMKLIKGMHQAAQEKGYVVSLYIAESDDEAVINIRTLIRSRGVDGFVITNPTFSAAYLGELKRYRIPYVFVGRPAEKAPYVDSDNVTIGRMATAHLIDHGHKRIAVLCGPDRFTFCQDRLLGYKEALAEAGLQFDDALVWRSELIEEEAYRVVAEHVLEVEITALFAVSDVQAVGAIRALRDRGFSVPADIAVVCVNNTGLTQHFSPPLTTVELHEDRLGYEAARRVIGVIEKEQEERPLLIPGELVVRESCGCRRQRPGPEGGGAAEGTERPVERT